VGLANGVHMTDRFSELGRLGFVFGCLGESPELGEAHDQPAAIKHRWGRPDSEILVDPIARQRRDVGRGQLDHSLVLAPEIVHMLEIGVSEDAESQVPEPRDDGRRARAGHERLVQLFE